jgi:hypothetical protein
VAALVPDWLVVLLGRDAWAIAEFGLRQLLEVSEMEELDFQRQPF